MNANNHRWAYDVFTILLKSRPDSREVIRQAKDWLDINLQYWQAYHVLVALIKTQPKDPGIVRRAKDWLDANADYPHAYNLLTALVKWRLDDPGVARRVIDWLDANVDNPHVYHPLAALVKQRPGKREVALRAGEWLDANIDNPNAHILLVPFVKAYKYDLKTIKRAGKWLAAHREHRQAYQVKSLLKNLANHYKQLSKNLANTTTVQNSRQLTSAFPKTTIRSHLVIHLEEIRSVDDIDNVSETLYGPGFDPRRPGVVHVTALWQRDDSALITLKIEARTPKSEQDFFALNLCRARADAIITSGKILREEKELRHDLAGPGWVADVLASWRRRLGKSEPPISLVLTSGRGLDLSHPLFHGGTRPLIYTSPQGREQLTHADQHNLEMVSGLEVIAEPNPDLRSAIAFLRRERQATTIVIETGPSTSMDLYEAPLAVDELLVSIYEEELDEAVQGGVFLRQNEIEARFTRPEPPFRVRSESGNWSFQRYLRPR